MLKFRVRGTYCVTQLVEVDTVLMDDSVESVLNQATDDAVYDALHYPDLGTFICEWLDSGPEITEVSNHE